MRLLHVSSSSNQLADIFNNTLSPSFFTINLSKLELIDIFLPPTCGRVLEKKQQEKQQQPKTQNQFSPG